MKVQPQYSYELNQVLNKSLSEQEQIKNFASLISDKDRFLPLLDDIERNSELIEKVLGNSLHEIQECYVVRAELFKSISLPIMVEYSIYPEEMLLFLIKEILKSNLVARFPDEEIREQYINSACCYIVNDGEWSVDLTKFLKFLDDESKKIHSSYEAKSLDFSEKTLTNHVEDLFEE